MQLEVNGVTYEGFTSCTAHKSMENVAGTFRFSAVSASAITLPIAKGDPCRVLVNGTPVITGYIEILNGAYDKKSHSLTLSGRDRTCDFIDTTPTNGFELNGGGTLAKALRTLLTEAGLTNISLIDDTNGIKPFTYRDSISGAIGETCFEIADRYCRKRQAVLTCDGKGNLVLTQASTTAIKTMLLNRLNGKQNNVKSAEWSDNDTARYAAITAYSPANFSASQDTEMFYSASASDPAIRATRNLVLITESSCDLATTKNRAIWEINVRSARAKIYNCVVSGFAATADNTIWQPNMLVQVQDDNAAIHGNMLIKDVEYTLGKDKGSLTKLTLVSPNAFTPEPTMSARQKAASNIMGDN
jgi:prophage tail gpP-like protein